MKAIQGMRPATLIRSMPLVAGMALVALAAGARAQQGLAPPPNGPATVAWDAASGRLTLEYHGGAILSATLTASDAAGKAVAVKLDQQTDTKDDKVTQSLTFTPDGPGQDVTLTLSGEVMGSGESFPAENESAAQQRFPMVRNSVGLSRNLRNNAVYDRRWDWVLFGPGDGTTRLAPKSDAEDKRVFGMAGWGGRIGLAFRPLFYQKHKGLAHFKPWTYRVWKESVTGYCTWWAYRGGFDQKALDEIVEVFAAQRLPDFGYRYVQIDDCFQTGGGSPEGFLRWNGKFPGGPKYFVEKIRAAGMEAGVWVFCVLYDSDPVVRKAAAEHPEWFVRGADGAVKRIVNPWTGAGFYALDTTRPEAVDVLVRPTYRGLKELGFTYVKIDGAGDLVDWSYRRSEAYLKERGASSGEALRAFYEAARGELGRDVYILTCWGVLPELIGVADGCRLATDGFRAASFQGFNSWEGVVWRNDPDHCDVLPGSKEPQGAMRTFGVAAAPLSTILRPCVIAMAGGVLLLSDKAEVYRDPANVEGAKRSSPVLFTVPGQLYDFTPRGPDWSFEKSFRDYVRRGGGEAEWWLQEIDRPFDHWSVLARFQWGEGADLNLRPMRGMPERKVEFADLGLEPERDYLVFEFWTQTFLGRFKGSFPAPAMDQNTAAQVFAIREARAYPWVLSTTRHISQGGVELSAEKWDKASNTLTGTSAVIAGDPYVLTVHLPAGFKLKAAAATGEKVEVANQQETATVRIVPTATKTVEWSVRFEMTSR